MILKQESDYSEFFAKALIPYVHYIPFKKDFSDLKAKIEFILQNYNLMEIVWKQANNFALKYLNSEFVALYFKTIIEKYATLQKSEPNLNNAGSGTKWYKVFNPERDSGKDYLYEPSNA